MSRIGRTVSQPVLEEYKHKHGRRWLKCLMDKILHEECHVFLTIPLFAKGDGLWLDLCEHYFELRSVTNITSELYLEGLDPRRTIYFCFYQLKSQELVSI